MDILRQPQGITHALRRMNQNGILGLYLPAFGRIVGQMQHDLFHVSTVCTWNRSCCICPTILPNAGR